MRSISVHLHFKYHRVILKNKSILCLSVCLILSNKRQTAEPIRPTLYGTSRDPREVYGILKIHEIIFYIVFVLTCIQRKCSQLEQKMGAKCSKSQVLLIIHYDYFKCPLAKTYSFPPQNHIFSKKVSKHLYFSLIFMFLFYKTVLFIVFFLSLSQYLLTFTHSPPKPYKIFISGKIY